MTNTARRTITALAVILFTGIAIVVYQFVAAGLRIGKHANAEYPTAGVIGDVATFVEENNGDWPTSWEQLGVSEEIQGLVVMRFDVTSEQILADPDLIYEVIQPVTGPFRVYPHSEENLEYLRERIEYMKNQ